MENIFSLAEACLQGIDIEQKIATTHHAFNLSASKNLSFVDKRPVHPISETSFPDRPVLKDPRNMPRRRFNTHAGKAAFFHALAHIEFIAIYLAWDMIYRFRDMPDQFYQDWLKVADDEARHFTLISNHLFDMNVKYGDLPAHGGLWEHAQNTQHDVLARLAIVPRCMEARGLDVTPAMIEKFQDQGDDESVKLLKIILEEEVEHVKIGSDWFDRVCQERKLNPVETYKELITKLFIGKPKGPFNRELRIIAGFSDAEINWLEQRS